MSIDSEKNLDSKQNLLKKTQKTLIMRNILFIVIFFIYNTLFSQISMKVSVFSKKEDDYMLKIEVIMITLFLLIQQIIDTIFQKKHVLIFID